MEAVIGIEKLQVFSLIGVHSHERIKQRLLIVDLKVRVDISACVKSDHLSDAINYEELAKICEEVGKIYSFHLIEAYAGRVMEEICARFKVRSIWLKVTKPNALEGAESAFIELERVL